MAKYVGRSSVCCQQNKYVIEARAGQPAFAFVLCENFLRYNIGVFFVGKLPRCPRRQSKRKSVKVFYPCNFVVSPYSKALRIPLRQDMSAGHRFAVSKINTLSRQGQPAFPFNPHLQASGKHLLFFGKEVIIKIINKGKRLSVEIPLTYARTE